LRDIIRYQQLKIEKFGNRVFFAKRRFARWESRHLATVDRSNNATENLECPDIVALKQKRRPALAQLFCATDSARFESELRNRAHLVQPT
jgi:hypothetical protein